jgi:hypothetical protein
MVAIILIQSETSVSREEQQCGKPRHHRQREKKRESDRGRVQQWAKVGTMDSSEAAVAKQRVRRTNRREVQISIRRKRETRDWEEEIVTQRSKTWWRQFPSVLAACLNDFFHVPFQQRGIRINIAPREIQTLDKEIKVCVQILEPCSEYILMTAQKSLRFAQVILSGRAHFLYRASQVVPPYTRSLGCVLLLRSFDEDDEILLSHIPIIHHRGGLR